MCGIIGVACSSAATLPVKELFQSLLYHDVVRGPHATGIAAIDTHQNLVSVVKAAMPSHEFLGQEEVKELFLHKHDYNIFIGHNRWATSGDKSKDCNAHPFSHGNIVGVHNGSLHRQSLLDDSTLFDVDSDNIFYDLDKNGIDDTLAKLDGSFTLVWYDKAAKSLNFIRNTERPLAVAKLSGGIYVWASEVGMLRWLVKRHKFLKFEQVEVEGTGTEKAKEDFCYQLTAGMLYTIPFEGRVAKKPLLVKKTLPSFPVTLYGGGYGNNYSNYGSQNRSTTVTYPERKNKLMEKLSNKLKLDDWIEIKLVEIDEYEHYNSTTTKTETRKRLIFEYRTHSDITDTIKVYHAGFDPSTRTLSEDNIGDFFFGRIGHAFDINSTVPDGAGNKIVGAASNEAAVVMSVFSIMRYQPSKFYCYNRASDEEITQQASDVPNEDNTSDVDGNVSNIEVATESEEKKPLSKKQLRLLRKKSRGGNQSSVSTTKSGVLISHSDRGAPSGVFHQLKNFRIDRLDMVDLSKRCNHRCSNCDKGIAQFLLKDLYVITQVDEHRVKHPYLLCSGTCHKEMTEWIKEFDNNEIIQGYAL